MRPSHLGHVLAHVLAHLFAHARSRGLARYGSLLFVASGLLACGAGGGPTTSADGGSAASGGNGSSANGPGSPTGGNGSGSGAKVIGHVTLLQSTSSANGSPTYKGQVSAGFGEGFASEPGSDCSTQTQGTCEVKVCNKVAGDVAPTGTPKSAGTISVLARGQSGQPVTLSPNAEKRYITAEASSTAGPLMPPGAAFTIKASGGDVPAFEGTVDVGQAIQIVAPQFSALMMTTLPKGPLEIKWTGTTDHVWAYLSAESGQKIVAVTCTFDGGTSGTVPAAVMNLMGNTGAITLATEGAAQAKAGADMVDLKALVVVQAGVFTK